MNHNGRLRPETVDLLEKVKDACTKGIDAAWELPITTQLHSYRVSLPKTFAAQLGLESIYFTISKHPKSRVWGGILRVWGSKKPTLSETTRSTTAFEALVSNYTLLDCPTFEDVQKELSSSGRGVIIKDVKNLSTNQLDSLDAILQRDGTHIILK